MVAVGALGACAQGSAAPTSAWLGHPSPAVDGHLRTGHRRGLVGSAIPRKDKVGSAIGPYSRVLILDELGYLPPTREEASLFLSSWSGAPTAPASS
jgi:hypothetical protein